MTYALVPLKAPRSQGALLRTLVRLAEGPAGAALARKFLDDIGVGALRRAEATDPPPMEHPILAAARGTHHPSTPAPALPAVRPGAGHVETSADFAAAYRAGTRTPVDVADALLAAIARLDEGATPLRAVVAQRPDDLQAQARASAARWAAGAPLGPLDGVPVGIKDELDQAGYATRVGTRVLPDTPAAADATVVARLRAQGALLFGKLNMHEIGMGLTGLNPHYGAVRNPYDPTRATGGSSSGPAAAVAAGLGPIAIGADGGGSIRVPAGLCGVFGLKATFGRVSEHGAFPLCWSLAHVGPLATSARDLALAYAAIAGPDAHDFGSTAQPPVDLPAFDAENISDLKGLRVGIYRPWFEDASPAIVAACQAILDGLVARGATVVDVDLPDLDLLRTAHLVTIASEMLTGIGPWYRTQRRLFGHDVRLNLALTRRLAGADYVHAQRLRPRFDRAFQAALARCDVIITPTTGCTAPTLPAGALKTGLSDLGLADAIMRFAPAGNLTGLPGISCPAGYDADGLPIGVQLQAGPWQEARLLRLACVIEDMAPRTAPKVHARLLT
ncbi:MAG: amidase [bacterium]